MSYELEDSKGKVIQNTVTEHKGTKRGECEGQVMTLSGLKNSCPRENLEEKSRNGHQVIF